MNVIKCKKCNKDITFGSNFCSACGSKIKLKYSGEAFLDAYEYISNKSYESHTTKNSSFSESYQKLLGEMYNTNLLLKSCNIVGYNIRLVEEFFGKLGRIEQTPEVLKIMNKEKNLYNKIKKITEYFDSINVTVVPDKVFLEKYSIIDPKEISKLFLVIANDFINQTLSESGIREPEEMVEVMSINISFGYIFRTVEMTI